MDQHLRPAGRHLGVALGAVVLFCLAGCASAGPDTAEAKKLEACQAILRQAPRAHGGPSLVLIYDRTASVSAQETSTLPQGLSTAITEASRADGTLSVIQVDGKDAEPTILLRDASLSTPGERNRPSVDPVAEAMPTCVQQVVLPTATPSGEGTDLGRAVARAAELSGPNTTIWIWSDFVWTQGQGAMRPAELSGPAAEAAANATRAVPVNLRGAKMFVHGVGNTSAPLLSANRGWLLEYAKALCSGWHASGCNAFSLDPVNSAAEPGLRSDPLPPFPTVATQACVGGTIRYALPSAILFSGDSARLRPEAGEVLADPVRVLSDNPGAKVQLVGHTASSRSYSRAGLITLSRERAEAVAVALRGAGVASARIGVRGVGDTQPLHEDLSADGSQNEYAAAERRVDLTITQVTSCA